MWCLTCKKKALMSLASSHAGGSGGQLILENEPLILNSHRKKNLTVASSPFPYIEVLCHWRCWRSLTSTLLGLSLSAASLRSSVLLSLALWGYPYISCEVFLLLSPSRNPSRQTQIFQFLSSHDATKESHLYFSYNSQKLSFFSNFFEYAIICSLFHPAHFHHSPPTPKFKCHQLSFHILLNCPRSAAVQ